MRLRLNFRNHRKIVVIDGQIGFIGGLNVGDEYLGRDEKFGPWRDTHLAIRGPTVQSLQTSFLRDWYFGTKKIPDLNWNMQIHSANQCALILTTGPVENMENCGLMFVHSITSAHDRVWIATPYFVPDSRVLAALQLAALKGIDVRIIMPHKADSILFKFTPYAYLNDLEDIGVKIYVYKEGFMHQKALLIDNKYTLIGTANMDNRSFYLNFEAVAIIQDESFCILTAEMFNKDFEKSSLLSKKDFENRSWRFRFAAQLTRLLSPIL